MKTGQLRHLTFITLAVIASQIALAEENQAEALTPDENIAKAISEFDYKPPKVRLQRSNLIRSTGNSGGTPVVEEYEVLRPNIWGIRSISKTRNGGIQGTSVSLCGIIELVGAGSSESSFESLIAIPINKVFMPFGIRWNLSHTVSAKATSLALGEGSKKICAPDPGDIFDYELRTDSESKNSSTFVSNRSHSNTIKMRCVVGEAKPIAELIAGQSGTYLPVTCSGSNLTTSTQLTADYAFIQAAGLYINLNRQTNAFRSTVTLSSLIYE